MTTTTTEYSALDYAYDFYNRHLFDGRLPQCLITLQRTSRARGYFWPERFNSRLADGETTDEIALNPDTFDDQSDEEILSTLVHEMVHLWHNRYGRPGRRGYHNKEWAAKMESLGLMPTSTGEPGGKRTGQRMTHLIIPGGQFDVVTQALMATGFCLTWQSEDPRKLCEEIQVKVKVKKRNKTKYRCDSCGLNVWAKPKANLWCADCWQVMLAQLEI